MGKDGAGGIGAHDDTARRPNFPHAKFKARAVEKIDKDGWVIVDMVDCTVKREHAVYQTVADIPNRVREEVKAAVMNAEGFKFNPPREDAFRSSSDPESPLVVNNTITDRGVLLLAYGALKNLKNEHKRAVAQIIKAHLWPVKK